MNLTKKEIKQRHFDKVYANAPLIQCACGCGIEIKSKDKYGRDKKYISGHNTPRKYEDPKQCKREWCKRNKTYKHEYKENYQRKRKVKLIFLLGCKCYNCSLEYNGFNACVFQFHHKNPENKEFGLNLNKMGKAWNTLLKELDKCELLCSNCHSIKHSCKY